MINDKFRNYLPVVVDIETGGFDSKNNAILEIAATLIDEIENQLVVGTTHRYHIEPYENLIIEKESLEFTKINLNHPLRNAISEKDALNNLNITLDSDSFDNAFNTFKKIADRKGEIVENELRAIVGQVETNQSNTKLLSVSVIGIRHP